jgi:hypothetical protein
MSKNEILRRFANLEFFKSYGNNLKKSPTVCYDNKNSSFRPSERMATNGY